ncbi:apurinic/apyrimidinic endonuclease Apn1, putative [Plasmodium chabaudi chabaudi]|uniref:Apurinic/apyrimidinic endonuclease Apn1, putative n=1 Tax=Plasmodium chabaudi chabaudi TaxID=31271 RepID=A0A1D3LIQ2_PLACU|nr:apurinic/apyrimidinic endonuclease Apn1, putative [Plasmodium chabaudi chabaudi]
MPSHCCRFVFHFLLYMLLINIAKNNIITALSHRHQTIRERNSAFSNNPINYIYYLGANKPIYSNFSSVCEQKKLGHKKIAIKKWGIERNEKKNFTISLNYYNKIHQNKYTTKMVKENKAGIKNEKKSSVNNTQDIRNFLNLKKEEKDEECDEKIKQDTNKENIKNETTVQKKKIDKNNKTKEKVKTKSETNKSVNITYPSIPKSIEKRWEDYNKIIEYAKSTNVYLGAHISASGGVQNAPINSFNVSGLAFALFLKNQRKWESPPLTEENIKQFDENCKKYNFDKNLILPHGSYLINLANPDKEKREKSYLSFVDDIKRCEQLNIKLYNFHPGSTVGMCSTEQGIKNIADCINRAHKETSNVIIVLENSAGQKNSVGSKFEHLRDIISQVDDKERIGVCLDTCHTFAAGYDIKTYEKFEEVMNNFHNIVDSKYLKAVHLNDSKSDLGSGLDRHENIGKGKLTLDTFKYIMTSKYFKNIPIVLETPDITNDESVYKYEIEYLYKMCVKEE